MDNSKYIEEIEKYITSLRKDIEGTNDSFKEQAAQRMPLAKKWLELLKGEDTRETEIESLAEKLLNY